MVGEIAAIGLLPIARGFTVPVSGVNRGDKGLDARLGFLRFLHETFADIAGGQMAQAFHAEKRREIIRKVASAILYLAHNQRVTGVFHQLGIIRFADGEVFHKVPTQHIRALREFRQFRFPPLDFLHSFLLFLGLFLGARFLGGLFVDGRGFRPDFGYKLAFASVFRGCGTGDVPGEIHRHYMLPPGVVNLLDFRSVSQNFSFRGGRVLFRLLGREGLAQFPAKIVRAVSRQNLVALFGVLNFCHFRQRFQRNLLFRRFPESLVLELQELHPATDSGHGEAAVSCDSLHSVAQIEHHLESHSLLIRRQVGTLHILHEHRPRLFLRGHGRHYTGSLVNSSLFRGGKAAVSNDNHIRVYRVCTVRVLHKRVPHRSYFFGGNNHKILEESVGFETIREFRQIAQSLPGIVRVFVQTAYGQILYFRQCLHLLFVLLRGLRSPWDCDIAGAGASRYLSFRHSLLNIIELPDTGFVFRAVAQLNQTGGKAILSRKDFFRGFQLVPVREILHTAFEDNFNAVIVQLNGFDNDGIREIRHQVVQIFLKSAVFANSHA